MRAHPAADLFPMMDDRELSELAADIKAHGQRQPIVTMQHDGETVVLDGRNRFRACAIAGVEPRMIPFGGDDPIALVISANMHRRHLEKSQRALIALELEKLYAEDAAKRQTSGLKRGAEKPVPATLPERGEAREKAAKVVNVSGRIVQEAKRVVARAPAAVVEAIKTGTHTVFAASEALNLPEEAQIARIGRTERPKPAPVEEESRPRLVVHDGGAAVEVRPGVLRVVGSGEDKRPKTGGRAMANPEGHALVRELTLRGRSITDIINETGFDKKFVVYARQLMSRDGVTRKASGVLDGAILDVEVFTESWASSVQRREPRWSSASADERTRLIAALRECRTVMSRAINWLNNEANGEEK